MGEWMREPDAKIMYDPDEGLEVVRFYRQIKGQDEVEIIPHQRMASIVCGNTWTYAECLRRFERLCAGSREATFYAEYWIHPEDVEKAERNTAPLLTEWDALCAKADGMGLSHYTVKAKEHGERPCWKTVQKSIRKLTQDIEVEERKGAA